MNVTEQFETLCCVVFCCIGVEACGSISIQLVKLMAPFKQTQQSKAAKQSLRVCQSGYNARHSKAHTQHNTDTFQACTQDNDEKQVMVVMVPILLLCFVTHHFTQK